MTAEESADVGFAATPGTREIDVAPRAYYGVGRVLQEFGTLGSTAGVLVNAMHRDFDEGSPLADLQPRNAAAFAGNTLLRFGGGDYELRAAGGTSIVDGTAPAIERVQRSSAHYAQRPDRTYSPLDPTLHLARRLDGAGEHRPRQRPPLAVGRQHQDRLGELRDQRPGDPERRRRLVEQRQPPLPRDPARAACSATTVQARRATPTRRCAAWCRPATCAARSR